MRRVTDRGSLGTSRVVQDFRLSTLPDLFPLLLPGLTFILETVITYFLCLYRSLGKVSLQWTGRVGQDVFWYKTPTADGGSCIG